MATGAQQTAVLGEERMLAVGTHGDSGKASRVSREAEQAAVWDGQGCPARCLFSSVVCNATFPLSPRKSLLKYQFLFKKILERGIRTLDVSQDGRQTVRLEVQLSGRWGAVLLCVLKHFLVSQTPACPPPRLLPPACACSRSPGSGSQTPR